LKSATKVASKIACANDPEPEKINKHKQVNKKRETTVTQQINRKINEKVDVAAISPPSPP